MKTLQIVLFRDGRPGHEKQSMGIVQSLRHFVEVEVVEVSVKTQGFIFDIFNHVKYFCNLDTPGITNIKPDLIIGTGSRTHIPILSCKRKFGGYGVTCMSPSTLIRNKFDLCFVPIHDRIDTGPNILQTIGPPNIAGNKNSHCHSKSMILVGGKDERSHRWSSEKLLLDIRKLIRFSKNQQWTISTSPRTPDETDRLLCSLVKELADICYIPFLRTEPGWIEQQYSSNKTVWVTGDSMSMVYEALTAGCRVGIIPVNWNKKDNKFLYSLNYLIDSKRVIPLNQYLDGTSFHDETGLLNESERCAKEILKRWWPENLQ
jgi:mitochondrial fission protein ELM1